MTIKYPTWRIKGKPTPNEKLVICDTCGHAEWTAHFSTRNPILCYHRQGHPNGKNARMREATSHEYAAAKKCLREEI